MKKVVLCLMLSAGTFCLSSILPDTISQAQAQGQGGFDYYEVLNNGVVVHIVGTITGWDNNGPHGTGTVTLTFPGGGSYSFVITFNGSGTSTSDQTGNGYLIQNPQIASSIDARLDAMVHPLCMIYKLR